MRFSRSPTGSELDEFTAPDFLGTVRGADEDEPIRHAPRCCRELARNAIGLARRMNGGLLSRGIDGAQNDNFSIAAEVKNVLLIA